MSIAKQIPSGIKRVSRAIGFAAWLDESSAWIGLSTVLRARLEPHQRAAMAYASLRSLDPEQVAAVVAAVLPVSQPPIEPLHDYLDEAAFWADMADLEALEAYCLASFNAMPRPRQAAFLEFVQARQAA